MKSSALRIGEVAERAGVTIDTVRYYEKRQLLPTASRTEGGFRLFTAETVKRVQFIKQAQELGFSLDEIGELLTIGGASECRRVRDHLKVKLTELRNVSITLRQLGEKFRLQEETRRLLPAADAAG